MSFLTCGNSDCACHTNKEEKMLMNQPCQVPDVKQTDCARALSELNGQIENLGSRLQILDNRLSVVLNPPMPTSPSAQSEKSPKSPLVRDLDNFTEKIVDLRNFVDNIIDKLSI